MRSVEIYENNMKMIMKKYYEKNISDHRVATLKNYESKRVETICECGRSVYLVSLKAHLKTKIHTQMLQK